MSLRRAALSLASVIAPLLLLSGFPARAQYLAEEPPDVVFSAAILAKAAELGNDPVRIYEFVHNEIQFRSYYGLMKGPEGTLLSRSGNDYDQAALLVSLLRAAGIPARFVRGKAKVSIDDIESWFGTIGPDSVVAAMRYVANNQPFYKPATGDDYRIGVDYDYVNAAVDFLHVWVETQVPVARYRGAKGGTEPGGLAWIALDPSFKRAQFRSDAVPPNGIDPSDLGVVPELTFDYLGPEGLYQKVSPQLPAEIFENQIRAYLAAQAGPGELPLPLDQAMLGGAIRAEAPGVLPTSLPYALSSAMPVARSASLAALHTPPGSPLPPSVGEDGPEDYRYVESIHVCTAGTLGCDALPGSDPNKLLEATSTTAGWQGKALLLQFLPTAATAPYLPDDGYDAGCNDTLGNPIHTTPTLSVDGSPLALANVKNIDLCNDVVIVLKAEFPLQLYLERARSVHTVGVGGTYAPSFDAWTASAAGVERASQRLLDAASLYPIVEDSGSGRFFVDNVVRNSTKDTGEKYLAVDFAAQRALTGGMLHLASERWFQLVRDGYLKVSDLHDVLRGFYPGAGLVSAGREVSYAFGQAFAISPSNLLIDVKGMTGGLFSRTEGYTPPSNHLLSLSVHHASASEHAIWEEIAGVEAISTVKGLQAGIEGLGEALLVITPDGAGPGTITPSEATSSCNGSTCSEIDLRTYCTIRQCFPGQHQDASQWNASCGPTLPNTTTELRVLARSALIYRGWEGYVYARYVQTGGGKAISMAISHTGTAGGGYATDYAVDPYQDVYYSDPSYDIPIEQYGYDEIWEYNDPYLSSSSSGDPVSVLNGNYFDVLTDFTIPGRGGMDIRFVRSYNSRLAYDGPLGYGWTHTFDQHLRVDAGDPGDPDDDRVLWVTERGGELAWEDTASGLVPPSFLHHELVREGDGSYTLTTKSGVVYRFWPENGSGIARLDLVRDRNGNAVHCEYDAGELLVKVIDSAGRELLFVNDGSGHLSEIRDWAGRVFRYTVDANRDLVEYMDAVQTAREEALPGSGKPLRYTYYGGLENEALNHNLKCWIQPEDIRAPSGEVGDLCGPEARGHAWMHFVYYSNDAVYKHTDSLGRETRFVFNYFRKRTHVTQPDGGTETHYFDGHGNITRTESAEGVIRDYEYDAERHERIRSWDGFGLVSEAAYDGDGNVIWRQDRMGEEESFTYNQFGQPTTHTDKRGHVRQWVYDAAGNLRFERADLDGPRCLLKEHRYDAYGNRTQVIEHADISGATPPNVTRFAYSPDGVSLTKITDALGHEVVLTPDALGRITDRRTTRTVWRDGKSRVERVATHTDYDELSRVVRRTDPVGLMRETEYDADGLVAARRTLIPASDGGPPTERVDVTNEYDAMLQLVASTNARGERAEIERDARGRIAETRSPLGRTTRYEYDLDGNLAREIDPAGGVASFEVDLEGRRTRSVDAAGQEHRTEYDAEGRAVRATGPGGRLLFEVLEFDAVGNAVRVADGEGFETRNVYDERNRLREQTRPVGEPEEGTTRFEYDLAGRLISRTDAEGRTVRVVYDELGRVKQETDALGRGRFFAYDEVGNLVHATNAAGQTLRYEYDSRRLLTRRTGPGVRDRFAYDLLGREVWASTPELRQSFEYDDLDRVIAAADNYTGVQRSVYDADGFVTQVVYPERPVFGFPGGLVVHYQYDERGQLASIVDPEAGVWSYEYDAAGRLVRRRDPGGIERGIRYDDRGFTAAVDIYGGGSLLEAIDYQGYDELGNPGQIASSVFGQTSIQYDSLSRVQQITYPASRGSESFTYDLVGNRKTHQTRQGENHTYVVDGADQLSEIRDTGTGALLYAFSHDAAGRRTGMTPGGGPTMAYAYDARGKLIRVTRSDGYSMRLAYGPHGGRYRRKETGFPPAYYLSPWAEHRGGEAVRLVRAGPGGAVVAEVSGGVVRGLVRDGRANVSHVTVAGAFASVRRYEGFGRVLAGPPLVFVERGFAGQAREGISGLVYMRARHYDPVTGRFLQADPLGIDAGQLYAYAANNPYRYFDPLGLYAVSASGGESVSYLEAGWNAVSDIAWGVGEAAVSIFVPGAGEALDAYTLADPEAAAWEKGIASVSLAVGVYTAGVSPNASGVIRGGRSVASGADELLDLARRVGDDVFEAVAEGGGVTRGVTRRAPDFVVSPGGTAYPVPPGATGPASVINKTGNRTGTAFTGGKGGVNQQVDTIRIMDPTVPRGRSPGYPNGYVTYENAAGQGVNPYTGRTGSRAETHFPLDLQP